MSVDDKRLERIEAKVDDISDHLLKIDVTLAQQHESLRTHIRRTALLEREVAPITKHVARVQGAIILISALAAAVAIMQGIKYL